MVTSGRVPKVRSRVPNEVGAREPGRRLARRALARGFALMLLAGCAAPNIQMGKPIAVERLSELTPGVSTSKDVTAVLGEPQGKGATRAQSYGLKDAWLYERTEMEGATARIRMLMVFLDRETGVYQGHMWMAAGALYSKTGE